MLSRTVEELDGEGCGVDVKLPTLEDRLDELDEIEGTGPND